MSDFLTRADILGLVDIEHKELTVPDHIPGWGGHRLYIRQLSRGQQDEYMKRQFGQIKMRQQDKGKSQELLSTNIYGHDAWLCIQGMCDTTGRPIFTLADEKVLAEKNGEAIGWIAAQIVEYSGMNKEVQDLQQAEEAIKNSTETQT